MAPVLAQTHQLPVAQEEAPVAEDFVAEEDLLDQEVIKYLESQIRQFRYINPINIRNLLNFPDEAVVSYLPDLDEVSQEHLPTAADNTKADIAAVDDDDDSEALPHISAAVVPRILQALETF